MADYDMEWTDALSALVAFQGKSCAVQMTTLDIASGGTWMPSVMVFGELAGGPSIGALGEGVTLSLLGVKGATGTVILREKDYVSGRRIGELTLEMILRGNGLLRISQAQPGT